MDNPIDNIVDLGLVNYVKHPTNPNYIVYRFPDPERAKSFMEKLEEKEIWFEQGEEQVRSKMFTLIGIHKRDFKQSESINYLVEAKHKKPLIPYIGFRYFVVLFGMILLILAIVGYCKQQEKLRSYDENGISINSEENNQ